MSSSHEFVFLAPEKMNHSLLEAEMYYPIFRYCFNNGIDLDLKLRAHPSKFDNLIELGYPRESLIDEKEFSNGTNKFVFANYSPGSPKAVENWFKTMYGHGDENFVYNQSIFWTVRHFRGILTYSYYDCYKFAFKKFLEKGKYLINTGASKFNNAPVDPRGVRILSERGYDPRKPTIVFHHTYNKPEAHGHVDYLDSPITRVLSSLSGRYNIINKAHVSEIDENRNLGFIDITAGEITTTMLYDIADIIIADYGGSVLDATLFDGPVIYIDGYVPPLPELDQNTDILIHRYQYHATPETFEEVLVEVIDNPYIEWIEANKKRWRDLLYEDVETSSRRFVELMIALNKDGLKGISDLYFNWNSDSVLNEKSLQFMKDVGLLGAPLKKNTKDPYYQRRKEMEQ